MLIKKFNYVCPHFPLSALIIFTIAYCSLAPSPSIAADQYKKDTSSEIHQNIEQHKVKIQRLQRGIREQQNKSQESDTLEKNILLEIEEIDSRLKAQLEKVSNLQHQVEEQEELINAKQTEINSLQTEKNKVLDHLKKRTGAYYKMGKVGFLNVTFSSKSLPELLRFHDSFQTLIAYDKDVVSRYRNKIVALERARDAYSLEKELLQEFVSTALAENTATDKIRDEKEDLLSHIRTQKHLHDQAIKELELASESLSSSLIALKNKEHDLKQTFAKSKGNLPSPLTGEVITFFNQVKANKLGIMRKSTGIAISAPDGSEVKAIAEGTVIFSGYLRGYGNTVIIHHGFQYYSVTSRLEKITVGNGENVQAGQFIGLLSDTATLIDEGLYFEIRHGKQSLDPLKWLEASKLQLPDPDSSKNRG